MNAARPVHLVIVQRVYAQQILEGVKTHEFRLTKTRRVPFGCVLSGDRLYLKVVSGPVVATAIAERVETHSGLTPRGVRSIQRLHASAGPESDAFFDSKRSARYATIVTLGRVEPVMFGPTLPVGLPGSARDGWRVLPGECEVYPACVGGLTRRSRLRAAEAGS